MAALALEGLGRRFGGRWALRGVALSLEPGEVVALLGANGAGKTTLLRCCATLLRPTEGRVRIAGIDACEDGAAARARLGFAGDAPRAYGDLTVEENLRLVARFHPAARGRVPELLEAVGLAARAHERARALSRGLAQRLAIARALIAKPSLLLLDEPFAPLDAEGRDRVLALLGRAAEDGCAVLFSSQDLAIAPPGCTRALALHGGRAAFDARGSPEALRARWREGLAGKGESPGSGAGGAEP